MLPTPEQIRAARALLKWGQGDLARHSDVSITAIAKIETENQRPTDQTLHKLASAFTENGIEFIDGGVRKARNFITVYEGEDCYLRLLDDAFLALIKTGGEVLFSAADERRSPPQVIEKLRSLRRSGVKMRSLVKDNDTYLMGDLHEYRWIDEKLFVDGDVKVIFENTVAYFMSWLGIPRVVIIQDKVIAHENRRIFDFLWNISAKPTHTTSDVFYQGK